MISQYIAICIFLVVIIISALALNAFQKDEEPEVTELKKEIAKLKEDEKKRWSMDYACSDMISKMMRTALEQDNVIKEQKTEILDLKKDLIKANNYILCYQDRELKKERRIKNDNYNDNERTS